MIVRFRGILTKTRTACWGRKLKGSFPISATKLSVSFRPRLAEEQGSHLDAETSQNVAGLRPDTKHE